MKIAITGAGGLFGTGIVQVLSSQHTVIPLTHADLEIINPENVRAVLGSLGADVVIHTAAMPDPDQCQLHPEEAFRVNATGTANVVAAAAELGCAVAQISTDAVFDGKKESPYLETDAPNPLSVYGQTKLMAERAVKRLSRHWIFRVSVLFGPGKKLNFVNKGLRKIASGEDYVVASDQVGSATYTLDAAQTILQVIESGQYGLYHLCNQGPCSRLELAQYAAQISGLDSARIRGVPLEQMGRPGPRPRFAVMEMRALRESGFALPRSWQEALAEYIVRRGTQRTS